MAKKKCSSKLKNQCKLYECLVKVPNHLRQHIIKHLDDDGINDICECIYNVIFTDLNISKRKKDILRKHIKQYPNIKNIINKKVSVSKRRQALIQHGSGIGLILSTVLPLLTSLFSK